MSLTQELKSEAHRLGFEMAGVTTPDPPPHISVYERWLGEGRHGDMDYLATDRARSRRADPRLILPECKSILVLGAQYPLNDGFFDIVPGKVSPVDFTDESIALSKITPGYIAAYACGRDYHDLFPPRLRALVGFIESRVGRPVPHRWYTDTGPLLERELAQHAGLGWIGKNTCLIAPGLGSYFLLAEILLGVDLEPDPPFLPDRCGSCTRCLAACPTGCILPDRTLDARRCISYLTIELKKAVPVDLRPQMDGWVFGCDVCQQVCPWNRFAPSYTLGLIQDLPAELELSPEEFNRRFRGTPMMRARRRGYLRNVAVALGNSRKSGATPALRKAMANDPEPLVSEHAAWALEQLGIKRLMEAEW